MKKGDEGEYLIKVLTGVHEREGGGEEFRQRA
jgi:hypothetical protein